MKERLKRKVGAGRLTSVIAFFLPFNPIVLPAFLAAIPPVVVFDVDDPAAAPTAEVGEADEDEDDTPACFRVERPIDSCSIST